jgi:hypothetical protein
LALHDHFVLCVDQVMKCPFSLDSFSNVRLQ